MLEFRHLLVLHGDGMLPLLGLPDTELPCLTDEGADADTEDTCKLLVLRRGEEALEVIEHPAAPVDARTQPFVLRDPARLAVMAQAVRNLPGPGVPVPLVGLRTVLAPGGGPASLGNIELAEPQLAATVGTDLLPMFHSCPFPSMISLL